MRILLLAPLILGLGSCDPVGVQAGEASVGVQGAMTIDPGDLLRRGVSPETGSVEPVQPPPLVTPKPSAVAWSDYPYQCETFRVMEGKDRVRSRTLGQMVYPVNFRRNRERMTHADRRRTYALVRMVATEMGFDPNLVEMHASHESSGRPETIHILNPDRDANQDAYDRHSFSKEREASLRDQMSQISVHDRQYWRLKSRLVDTVRYKGNPHWETKLKYTRFIPERPPVPAESWDETQSVWWYGYGLYGMNAVLYTHIWDSKAPPWIMCSDEGIVATVMYVWVARDAKSKCEALTAKDSEKYGSDGGNNRGIIRRMAKGRCGKGTLGPVWRRLMREFEKEKGVDWDASAQVGEKWPAWELYRNGEPKRDKMGRKIPTDRLKVLEYMRKKAKKRGLLRTKPLARAPGTEPRLVVRRP
jgi:hypothetical protein